jgi:excinuclease ABC subunit B
VAEPAPDYRLLKPEQVAAKIRQLEAQMYKHAQDLEFEDAARLRDEIHRIREQGLIG